MSPMKVDNGNPPILFDFTIPWISSDCSAVLLKGTLMSLSLLHDLDYPGSYAVFNGNDGYLLDTLASLVLI